MKLDAMQDHLLGDVVYEGRGHLVVAEEQLWKASRMFVGRIGGVAISVVLVSRTVKSVLTAGGHKSRLPAHVANVHFHQAELSGGSNRSVF